MLIAALISYLVKTGKIKLLSAFFKKVMVWKVGI